MPLTLPRKLVLAVPWIPSVPVLVIVGLLGWAVTDLAPDFASRQLYLRAGLLVVALGLSFAFDDPAAPTTDPVPSPLRRRRALRFLLSTIPWMAGITVLLWAGLQGGLHPVWLTSVEPLRPELPVGRLLLEAATMACWGLAIASVIARRWEDEPGRIASAALLGIYALSWMIPERWKPWSDPSDVRWKAVLPWWWAALAVAVLVAVVSSWDSRSRSGPLRRWKQPKLIRTASSTEFSHVLGPVDDHDPGALAAPQRLLR